MYSYMALITLILSCCFLLNLLKFKGIVENIIFFFCLCSAQIVLIGYLLSVINKLGDIRYWAIMGILLLLIIIIIILINPTIRKSLPDSKFNLIPIIHKIKLLIIWYKKLPIFQKFVLTPIIFTTFLVGIINLITIVYTAPNNIDSMTYHLARVAYFLQHNNINYFGANYWAQVTHPKNSSLLLLFTYLVSGRNENLTQLVQYISYWIAVSCVYGISRTTGNNRTQSIFSALVSALLINWLMEATTTQNDLIITAFLGLIIYSLFAYYKSHEWKYLIISSLGIGLSIGIKANVFLPIISIAFIVIFIFINPGDDKHHRLRAFCFFVLFSVISISMFAFPAGYLENYKNFGHPIGPQNVREDHAFEGESLGYILKNGTKNLIRYGLDSLSLDGIYPANTFIKIQDLIRFIPLEIIKGIGIDLESEEASRVTFFYQKKPLSNEDRSYTGVFGFGLIWLMVILSLTGVLKSEGSKLLSFAAVIFFITQAYSGPYDPWRGRYFISWAIFAVPTIGPAIQVKNKYIRGYLFLIILLGCISALSSVCFKETKALLYINEQGKITSDLFSQNRLFQLTNGRRRYETLVKYEKLVPIKATVATYLQIGSFEYPLFGKSLTRTILPINSFDKGLQPIPVNAQYLLYDVSYPCASTNDINLGNNWFLRHLTDLNRNCP